MSTVIIPGSGSTYLAYKIADHLGVDALSHRVVHFVNSEMKVTLPEGLDHYDRVLIVQSTSNPANENFMELALLADTARREGLHIEAIIPYFGYARQDKQHLPKECISLKTISGMLQSVGIDKVYTVDIHNPQVLTQIDLPITNLSAMTEVARQVYQDLRLDVNSEPEVTIASPDDGGIDRAQEFAKHFYQNPRNSEFVSVKKKRYLDKTHYSEAVELRGEISDKRVILVDDVSTSGGTILNAMKLCQANGVKEVYAVIIHADFAQGVGEKFQNSELQKVYTTNSIEKPVERLEYYDKIQVLDISRVFSQAVT